MAHGADNEAAGAEAVDVIGIYRVVEASTPGNDQHRYSEPAQRGSKAGVLSTCSFQVHGGAQPHIKVVGSRLFADPKADRAYE